MQKNYIWIILLNWKKHKSHQGLMVICTGVIMNRPAQTAISLAHLSLALLLVVESYASCVILQKSGNRSWSGSLAQSRPVLSSPAPTTVLSPQLCSL